MFETAVRPGNSGVWLRFVGLYFLQLVLSYPLAALVAQPFAAILSVFGLSGNYPSHVHFAGYDALVYVLAGILVGWSEGRWFPGATSSGRWIWLLPCLFVFPDFVTSLFRAQAVPCLNEYLFETAGEGGLGVAILSYPVCCATGYSIGMFIADAGDLRASVRYLVLCLVSWLGVFVGTAPLLAVYERASIQAWSSVRHVVQQGLMLSKDPDALCASESAGVLSLNSQTMVKSFETRNCGGDRLLLPGAAPQPKSWTLERVKVLSGPNAGAEGWVQSYGLLETMR